MTVQCPCVSERSGPLPPWRAVSCLSPFFSLGFLAASAAAAKSLQSCPTLCDPIDGSPPGSPVPGILQARTLEGVAISFSNAWKWKVKAKSLSHVQLLDPMDCSLPGSSVHGIFQARGLEWGAIAFAVAASRKHQTHPWPLGSWFPLSGVLLPGMSALLTFFLSTCLNVTPLVRPSLTNP